MQKIEKGICFYNFHIEVQSRQQKVTIHKQTIQAHMELAIGTTISHILKAISPIVSLYLDYIQSGNFIDFPK